MMTRLLGAAFAVALTVQLAGSSMAAYQSTTTTTMEMKDINGYWAQPQIEALISNKLMTGYTDGTFRPENTITRAEFASLLMTALQLQPGTPAEPTFKDVPADFWAYQAIETMKTKGLFEGTTQENFMPNKPIDRLTVIKALAKIVPGEASEQKTARVFEDFNDGYAIPKEDRAEVAQAVEVGIFANNPNYGAFIQPNRNATRGEVAAMMGNLLASETGTTEIPMAKSTNNYYIAKYSQGNMRPYVRGNYQKVSQTMGVNVGRMVTVPENTEFKGSLMTPMTSLSNLSGKDVEFKLSQPIASSDNVIVVPSNSTVKGEIISTGARTAEGLPMVNIRLKEIVKPNSERLNVEGEVASFEQPIQETPVAQYVRVKLQSPMELMLP